MFELFQMWAFVEVLGLICLPLTMTVCHNLPDRGWAFSKTLGLALLAFLVWLPLMVLQFLPFSQLFIAGVVLLLCAGNVLAFVRMRPAVLKWLRLNISYIIMTELVFAGMVLLLGWVRSYGPNIQQFEMFMDEGFIASIMRSTHFPPSDMWFSGYSLNYYYYAHYVVAMLAKLLGQSPSIAFNTGICLYFGLTAVGLFGVTCNITAWARQQRAQPDPEGVPSQIRPPLLGSVPYGLFTVLLGLILGNLAATQQWWQNHGTDAPFDWFQQPTRVIDRTINEFPAFSFLLSCFHAHVLALAFTIVAVGLAFNLLLETRGRGLALFGQGLWQRLITLFMTALITGGLFVMNGWDYPTYMGLVLVCIGLQQLILREMRLSLAWVLDVITPAVCLVALSFLLYLPFYLNFLSPSLGLGIVASEADRSQLRDELLIYGIFAFLFVSLLFASALRRPLRRDETNSEDGSLWQLIYIATLLVCDMLVFWLLPNSTVLVVFGSVAALGVLLLFTHIGDRSHAFTLLLGSLAFALVAGCEVFFLKDVFVYQNYARMNTVFKFYFQAWALLAITSGCGLYFILQGFRSIKTVSLPFVLLRWGSQSLWSALLLLFLLAGSIYPLLAPLARYAQLNPVTNKVELVRSNSLDGLTYLQTFVANEPQPQDDPNAPKKTFLYNGAGDYAAIRWLNEHVSGDPVIIEAVGDDYSVYGRVSAFTGLPTLMGWVGHEYQWRVNWLNNGDNATEFNRRKGDLDSIYRSTSPEQVLSLLKRYNAEYIYVGPLEYGKYPDADLKRFASFMQVVYDAQGVTIYKKVR